MKDEKIITLVAVTIIGVILVPIVIGTIGNLIGVIYTGVGNAIIKSRFNKEIKKGLKDGSIVEIDGQFYEVKQETVEEA